MRALTPVFWVLTVCALIVVAFRFLWVNPGYYWSSFLCEPLFPNSTFEQGTLIGWTPEGRAFEGQPIEGDSVAKRGRAEGAKPHGKFWIGTYEKFGDKPVGRLISDPFVIKKGRMSFLLGGGNGTQLVGVGLEIDGKMALFAKSNSRLWTSERMSRVVWDVSEFRGKKARLLLIDHSTGYWGHLNADDFRYA